MMGRAEAFELAVDHNGDAGAQSVALLHAAGCISKQTRNHVVMVVENHLSISAVTCAC